MEEQDLRGVMSDDVEDVLHGNLGDEGNAGSGEKRKRNTRQEKDSSASKRKKPRPMAEEDAMAEEYLRAQREQQFSESVRQNVESASARDPIPRRKKIQKIEAWFKTFPETLRKIAENSDLENMTDDQLNALQTEIKQVVGTGGGSAMGEMLPYAGLSIYESIMVGIGVNVQGISNLAHDPAFSQACKEIMLDFTDMTYIPPHWRVLLILGNATWHLHEKNSAQGSQKTAPSASTSNEADEMRKEGQRYESEKNSST